MAGARVLLRRRECHHRMHEVEGAVADGALAHPESRDLAPSPLRFGSAQLQPPQQRGGIDETVVAAIELRRDQIVVGGERIRGGVGVDLKERKVPREMDAKAGIADPDRLRPPQPGDTLVGRPSHLEDMGDHVDRRRVVGDEFERPVGRRQRADRSRRSPPVRTHACRARTHTRGPSCPNAAGLRRCGRAACRAGRGGNRDRARPAAPVGREDGRGAGRRRGGPRARCCRRASGARRRHACVRARSRRSCIRSRRPMRPTPPRACRRRSARALRHAGSGPWQTPDRARWRVRWWAARFRRSGKGSRPLARSVRARAGRRST